MKKYLYILIFTSLIIPTISFADSGACSYHDGVNCSAGPNVSDGTVICNDGSSDSSVLYINMNECNNVPPIYCPSSWTQTDVVSTNNSVAQLQQQADNNLNEYESVISQIENGTYPLNPNQQSQINNYKQQTEALIQQQQTANQNLQNGMAMSNFREGGSYSPDTYSQVGSSAVNNLTIQMNGTIASLTQSFLNTDVGIEKELYSVEENSSNGKIGRLLSLLNCNRTDLVVPTESTSTIEVNNSVSENITQNIPTTTESQQQPVIAPQAVIQFSHTKIPTPQEVQNFGQSSGTESKIPNLNTVTMPRTLPITQPKPSKFQHWYDWLNPFNWF